MNQHEAPLYEAVLRHAHTYRSFFHVPGHKQGRFFDEQGRPFFHPLLTLDLTEVGELDDLHHPTGVIRKAEELAAEAFHATRTWFLVGGSTVGNLALILASCVAGDHIVMQRNSHKSLYNGCLLRGVRPICLQPQFDSATGVYTGIGVAQLKRCLERYPHVKAVFLTHPNYYGATEPIAELAVLCGQFGVPLFVDEAHGAHFSAHPGVPLSAISGGATAVVQSTHKMLPAMTMGAMLHAHGSAQFREKLQESLTIIQSSSPSYPLMASLDLARRYYATRAYEDIEMSLPYIQTMREEINRREGWRALSYDDPYKIILRREGWSGYDIVRGLMAEGIALELSDRQNGLALLPLGIRQAECGALLKAVDKWREKMNYPQPEPVGAPQLHMPEISEPLPLSQFTRQKGEWCLLANATGRKAKQMVLPYPPGIPAILPGEIYSERIIEDLQSLMRYGARLEGLMGGGTNARVEVIK